MVSMILMRGTPILLAVIVSRMLGREAYGEFSIAQRLVVTFGLFGGVGLGLTATKHMAEYLEVGPGRTSKAFTLILISSLIFSGVISLVLLLSAPLIADRMYSRPDTRLLVILSTPAVFFNAIFNVLYSFLTGFQQFKRTAIVNGLQCLTGVSCMLLLCHLLARLGALLALNLAMLFACILASLCLWRVCSMHGIRLDVSGMWEERLILSKFALPTALCGFIFAGTQWVATAFLVRTEGGIGEIAVFEASNQVRMLITFAPTFVGAVILPMLASSVGRSDYTTYRKVLRLNLASNLGIGFILTVLVWLFADDILAIYGPAYAGQATVLRASAVGGLLCALATTVGHVIASLDKMWLGVISNLVWGLSLIVGAYVGVQYSGALGLALAFVISYLLHIVVQLIILRKTCLLR